MNNPPEEPDDLSGYDEDSDWQPEHEEEWHTPKINHTKVWGFSRRSLNLNCSVKDQKV